MSQNARRRPLTTDGARRIDHCEAINLPNNQIVIGTQIGTIRAEIIGSNYCTAENCAVHGPTPVLKLCRQLLAAGFDPARPLDVYRGAALALRIRSIGEGAKLTVDEHNDTHFSKWKPFNLSAGSAPIRQNELVGVEP